MKPKDFLHPDNEKAFHCEAYQAILDTWQASKSNMIGGLSWRFDTPTAASPQRETILEFHNLTLLDKQYPEWATVVAPLGLLCTSQWLVTEVLVEFGINNSSVRSCRVILQLFWFLAERGEYKLDSSNLDAWLEFMIMNTWHGQKPPMPRFQPGAYSMQENNIGVIRQLPSLCALLGCPRIAEAFSTKAWDRSLKNVLNRLAGDELTLSAYKKGGSFNYLGLDYGRHFVEFSYKYFNQHISTATALVMAIQEEVELFAGSAVYKPRTITSYKSFVTQILTRGDKGSTFKQDCWHKYIPRINQRYVKHLTRLTQRDYLLGDDGISSLAQTLKVNVAADHALHDRLGFIAAQRYWLEGVEVDHLLTGDLACITAERLDSAIQEVLAKLCIITKPPTEEFYSKIGLKCTEKRIDWYQVFISSVKSAGQTVFLALNGWRSSEHRFGIDNLFLKRNDDILDQTAFPYRMFVDANVFKTNGTTPIDREITLGSFCLLRQLNELQGEVNLIFNKRIDTHWIARNWRLFIETYTPFVELRELKALSMMIGRGDILTDVQRQRYTFLKQKANDKQLQDALNRGELELDRIELFVTFSNKYNKNRVRNNSLIHHYQAYLRGQQHQVDQDDLRLLNHYLSDELKDYLRDVKEVTNQVSREAINALVEGCLYPSPHALRHMWAESVYRRFDGDVGWFIRSQFKHISQNMWLAYIRDKDGWRMARAVQNTVKISLITNHFQQKGEGHAGRFSRFLDRIVQKTHVATVEQFDEIIRKLALFGISEMKANPWGFCLLRERQREFAKCADFGQPNRIKAEPKLCLGCIHNLSKESNLEYILLSAQPHLKLLTTLHQEAQPSILNGFIQESRRFIKDVLSHLRKLDPGHPELPHIEKVFKTGVVT